MPTSQPLVWSSPASHSLGMVYDLDMLDAIWVEKKNPEQTYRRLHIHTWSKANMLSNTCLRMSADLILDRAENSMWMRPLAPF